MPSQLPKVSQDCVGADDSMRKPKRNSSGWVRVKDVGIAIAAVVAVAEE